MLAGQLVVLVWALFEKGLGWFAATFELLDPIVASVTQRPEVRCNECELGELGERLNMVDRFNRLRALMFAKRVHAERIGSPVSFPHDLPQRRIANLDGLFLGRGYIQSSAALSVLLASGAPFGELTATGL